MNPWIAKAVILSATIVMIAIRAPHGQRSRTFYSVGQLLVLPNWLAGPSYLVTFGILFALRVRAEEGMMIEEFGADYAAYVGRTKRLVPGVW